jgi:hypothetical protein
VPEDDRDLLCGSKPAIPDREIELIHRASPDAHQRLIRAWLRDGDILQG